MASKDLDSGNIKKQEIDDIMTCSICLEVYKDPTALPCIHTFCMKCIEEIGLKANKGPGDEMPCPLCRQPFKIPSNGFPGLPKHFFIQKLIQATKVSDSSAGPTAVCDVCLEYQDKESDKEIPVAAKFCLVCRYKLCEECCIEHEKYKVTRKHRLITLDEYEDGQDVRINLEASTCQLHEHMALDVYCADCKTVMCAICSTEGHSEHNMSHVDKHVDGIRTQVQSYVDVINECRIQAETKNKALLKVKENILSENLRCDFEIRNDEVKQLTDMQPNPPLEEICLIQQSKLKEIKMATDDIDTYLTCLNTYNSYCQNVMTKGSASDICRAFSDLSTRALEFQQHRQRITEIPILSFHGLEKSKVEESLKTTDEHRNCANQTDTAEVDIHSETSLEHFKTTHEGSTSPSLAKQQRKNILQKIRSLRFRMMGNESSPTDFDTEFFNKYATPANLSNKGAFGTVYGPIRMKKKQLAIKQVMFANGQSTEEIEKDIKEKQQIWNSLKHKHLMRILSVNLSQLPKVMYIVMGFAGGGSLNETLRSLGLENKLPIVVVTDWTKQIAEGMKYLHQKNIVHRDLKPSNVLLSEPFDFLIPLKTITLKITDFDDVKQHTHTTTMSFVGTIKYMAPEVFRDQWFSKASDVWSFGVLVWEMLSGDIPHKGLQPSAIMAKSVQGKLDCLSITPSFPDDYKFILKQCWKSTCEDRFSFQQILDVLYSPGDSYKSDLVLVQTIITKSANRCLNVVGFATAATGNICIRTYAIAILDKELFVVSSYNSKVDVYDANKFSLNRQVKMQDLNEPWDIVSCTRNRCLYILHRNGYSFGILRVDLNGKLLKKWSIEEFFIVSLSVAGKGNILATATFRNKLIEYSSNGEFIREINLSQDTGVHHPLCAIQVTNEHFVISHGYGSLQDDLHGVSIVDAGGKVQKSFTFECGSTIARLHNPSYLLVDSDGFVMVSADRNERILLLDSNLRFKREILTKEQHDLKGPMKILLDKSTGRLFVADNLCDYEGRILIFDCK